MLRDRYDPMNLFDLVPQLSLEMEPVLAGLDRLLDDDQIFSLVRSDLSKRFPGTRVWGRPSTPVEVILRILIVKRLYGWSYEETERHVSDSLVLRQFCRLALDGSASSPQSDVPTTPRSSGGPSRSEPKLWSPSTIEWSS